MCIFPAPDSVVFLSPFRPSFIWIDISGMIDPKETEGSTICHTLLALVAEQGLPGLR